MFFLLKYEIREHDPDTAEISDFLDALGHSTFFSDRTEFRISGLQESEKLLRYHIEEKEGCFSYKGIVSKKGSEIDYLLG